MQISSQQKRDGWPKAIYLYLYTLLLYSVFSCIIHRKEKLKVIKIWMSKPEQWLEFYFKTFAFLYHTFYFCIIIIIFHHGTIYIYIYQVFHHFLSLYHYRSLIQKNSSPSKMKNQQTTHRKKNEREKNVV